MIAALVAATIITVVSPPAHDGQLCVCIAAVNSTAQQCSCVPACQPAQVWIANRVGGQQQALTFTMPISRSQIKAAYAAAKACGLSAEAEKQSTKYWVRYGERLP